MRINKKGELSTKFIVGFLVLLASFAIILFLYFRLNLGGTTDKEICHNSVVLVSKGKGLAGQLDCKINYLCISGGGECEGINPTTTTEVNRDNKDEIMKAIADEMADCWWMFGEGELDYRKGLGQKRNICAVCAIVKFDKAIQSAQGNSISYSEFMDSLSAPITRDSDDTYLNYIYGVNSVDGLLIDYDGFENYLEEYIVLDEKHIIMTGESEPGIFRRIFLGEEPRHYLVPFFIEINSIPEGINCDEYVTKS